MPNVVNVDFFLQHFNAAFPDQLIFLSQVPPLSNQWRTEEQLKEDKKVEDISV